MPIEGKAKEQKKTALRTAIEDTNKKVKSSVLPLIKDHIENDEFDHDKDGLDFLKTKNSLMLSYMIDLTQLLRLKSSKKVDSGDIEECLGRLREMRVLLEKVRPLEKKMRYQLDKLLAISASSSSFAATNFTNDEQNNDVEESDPLAFRPNPDSMFGKDNNNDSDMDSSSFNKNPHDGDEESVQSSDESDNNDEELMAARVAFKAGRSKKYASDDDSVDNQGVYKAPRLAAVPFAEKETQSDKEERILKRQRERMRKSELLSTLKSAFGDAPEEDDFDGGASLGKQRESAQRFSEKQAEKERYEEEAMVRLTSSRKEKKMRNKIMREEVSNLNSISDLGNLTAGVSVAFGTERSNGRDEEELKEVGGRHVNGKRRRNLDESEPSKRGGNPKNSFQKALYGIEGGGGGNKKKNKKKSRK